MRLHICLLLIHLSFTHSQPKTSAPSPANLLIDPDTNYTAYVHTSCDQCILQKEADKPYGTQCQLHQQWFQEPNYLCGPDTGLGCELALYEDGYIPLNVTFTDINGTAIKPECDLRPNIPTNNETGIVMLSSTGKNCTGNLGIYLQVASPCYQSSRFLYGFEGHSLVTPCSADGTKDTSNNPLGRYLEVKIQLDIYKYGEIAGPHVRGVVNLVSATCAWIPGSRKMNHGTLEISYAIQLKPFRWLFILMMGLQFFV